MARVRRTRNVENLSGLLDRIAAETSAPDGAGAKETVRVGDLLNAIGRRAYGPLLLAIGLFSISPATIVPGLTWASAVLTFVVAAQLALGLKRPWMPRRVLAIAVPRAPLDGAIRRARPWAARIDKIVRPRFVVLADPPWVNMAGLLAMAAAVVTIPLGFIPFAPLVPGLAIVLLGLGVTARDGLLLSYGAAAMVGAGWLVWREAPALAGFLAGLWPG
ncbi:MAG: exopolysaccharide biosynthesis protein [Alphaproteobacteria bacterium]|nr:exopolysaccharide biosynthesis protein [Alphaproteobacteria bacterium]